MVLTLMRESSGIVDCLIMVLLDQILQELKLHFSVLVVFLSFVVKYGVVQPELSQYILVGILPWVLSLSLSTVSFFFFVSTVWETVEAPELSSSEATGAWTDSASSVVA